MNEILFRYIAVLGILAMVVYIYLTHNDNE